MSRIKDNSPRKTTAWGVRTPGCFFVFPQTIRYNRTDAIFQGVQHLGGLYGHPIRTAKNVWRHMKRAGHRLVPVIIQELKPRVPAPDEK